MSKNTQQKLRMLINRIDVVRRNIRQNVYDSQAEIASELVKVLLQTGEWVH